MKTAIVTGANSGIGFVTARELLKDGYRVLCLSRNMRKLDAAVQNLATQTGSKECLAIRCDLASFKSIRNAVQSVKDCTDEIHLHINNAGLILSERQITEDSHEATFQINHLGPFLLTQSLLPLIEKAAGASGDCSRIINVSSIAHKAGLKNFWDFKAEKSYKQFDVYGRSKLANILYAKALATRLDPAICTANALHPGVIKSAFGADGDTKGLFAWGVKLMPKLPNFISGLMTVEQGAETTLYVARSEEGSQVTGQYFKNSRIAKPKTLGDEAIERFYHYSLTCSGAPEIPASFSSH